MHPRFSPDGARIAFTSDRDGGDNLWVIAAKPEVYGNANLWPLIWRANPKSLPQPDKLRVGHGLRFPLYPSLKSVADAIEYASRNPLASGGSP